tara:strand:- start:389 stop:757 length:369 start_codon:yes stop_codon:yes gene_type:complete
MAAAEFGHLEVLQLLHENGCPWKEETCAMASSSGKLEVTQWLRTNGCLWNARTFFRAERVMFHGDEMSNWLIANGCPKLSLRQYQGWRERERDWGTESLSIQYEGSEDYGEELWLEHEAETS